MVVVLLKEVYPNFQLTMEGSTKNTTGKKYVWIYTDLAIENDVCSLHQITIRVASDTLTAQKMKFSIKDFFSKCDQIRRKLRIWSHLLKKSLMENFIFCAAILFCWNTIICTIAEEENTKLKLLPK